MVLLQRSRGYSSRPSLRIEDIRKILGVVREVSPQTICFVDNCYGEFAAEEEPLEAGAHIIAGSLIKNPGSGKNSALNGLCRHMGRHKKALEKKSVSRRIIPQFIA